MVVVLRVIVVGVAGASILVWVAGLGGMDSEVFGVDVWPGVTLIGEIVLFVSVPKLKLVDLSFDMAALDGAPMR